jgi:hypothetical protein
MFTVWLLLPVLLRYAPPAHAAICLEPVCEYHFHVYRAQTMTYATRNETFNVRARNGSLEIADSGYWDSDPGVEGRRVSEEGVITADGVQRSVITINGQFPGPTVEVMQGTQVSESNAIR